MADRVIFKKDEHGDVIAFFPQQPGTNSVHTCMCYQHVGQHGSAAITYVANCKPAKPSEYADLKAELERLGYELEIVRRTTRADEKVRRAALLVTA